MKMKVLYPCFVLFSAMCALSSCQKEASTTTKTTSSTAAVSSSTSLAVSALSTTSGTDSVYLVNCNPPHSRRDTIAASALPAAISTYLTTNYSGYTFGKSFIVKDSLKVTTGYIVVIKYNKNIVGLKFDATGTFVSVLEQMDGKDMKNPGGPGFHPGGPFDDRDGKGKDTVALSAIPSDVLTYFTTNYPSDTLLHASLTPDTNYVLISKNKVLYATDITAAGGFVKRVQLDAKPGPHKPIAEADLPSSITTYLTTTYPGYVFNQAFADGSPGTAIKEYHVFITVNSTNYVIDFDSTGTFLKATTIH